MYMSHYGIAKLPIDLRPWNESYLVMMNGSAIV